MARRGFESLYGREKRMPNSRNGLDSVVGRTPQPDCGRRVQCGGFESLIDHFLTFWEQQKGRNMGGREVRRVPKDWQHPIDWEHYDARRGPSFLALMDRKMIQYYEEGEEVVEEHFMPAWTEEEATHFMMYETVSEGTPMSPAFETPEELARWLADHGANYGAFTTATYETWLEVCRDEASPCMIYSRDKGLRFENL